MAIELERARIIDLEERIELLPGRMTLGASLPGYQTGWFRTRQWGKGFYLLTERRRVLWLPTRSGKSLLLSLERPDARVLVLYGGWFASERLHLNPYLVFALCVPSIGLMSWFSYQWLERGLYRRMQAWLAAQRGPAPEYALSRVNC